MQNPSSQPTYQVNEALKPLPPEDWPCIDHIETEDGNPVDNVFSEKQMRLLTEPLYSSWKTEKPFVALANVGLFYGVDLPPLVPDTLLSINVRLPENLFPKLNRSYFVWKYGKPPEVVIEVVSNRKGGEDTEKRKIYADVRVSNYVIYDPENHLSDTALRAYRLQQSELVPYESTRCFFPEVGLGLTIWSGRYENTDAQWLRWTDADGNLVPTGHESALLEAQRADEAVAKASEATKQASEATKQASEAIKHASEADRRAAEVAAENAKLLELLRRHHIDPDSLDH